MNWKLIVCILATVAGFCCTCWGAIQFDRLQYEGVQTEWWSYPVCVGLPFSGAALLLALRICLRWSGAFAPLGAGQHRRSLDAIAVEVRDAMRRGDTATVRVKANAADVIQGKAASQ